MSYQKSFLLLFCLIFVLPACNKGDKPTKVIKSNDGSFQVVVPSGWKEESNLNDTADLQVAHRPSNMFLIVLAENKADLADMSVDRHSQITRDGLTESLQEVSTSEPKDLLVGGLPAVQYEIRGTHENVRIIYLHTTVESPTHFYQILAWTVPSRWEENKKTLERVTGYFKENN